MRLLNQNRPIFFIIGEPYNIRRICDKVRIFWGSGRSPIIQRNNQHNLLHKGRLNPKQYLRRNPEDDIIHWHDLISDTDTEKDSDGRINFNYHNQGLDRTAFQINDTYGFQSGVKVVGEVKLMYIYHKLCENIQKIQ